VTGGVIGKVGGSRFERHETYESKAHRWRYRDLFFQGPQGDRLSGRLAEPEGKRGWAIFVHGFTCAKASLAATRVTRALARHGVLRFDFAGLGAAREALEIRAARQLGRSSSGRTASLLIGHSLGGAAVLMAAPTCRTFAQW
jgi:putative redox protein